MGLVPRHPGQYFVFNAPQPMLFESHMTIFHGHLESVPVYLKNYGWNAMKYRADKSLKELLDALQLVILFKRLVSMHYCLSKKIHPSLIGNCNGGTQEVTSVDNLMKSKLAAYTQAKSALQAIQRKAL